MYVFFPVFVPAQSFAPAAGFSGTTAMYKDNSEFIAWATSVEIQRGFIRLDFPENGYVDYGTPENALGKSDGNPNVVSLGDGGVAVLQFDRAIANGTGYDFAVFENGFFKEENSEWAFLELAFVEVSTDGVHYVRFPAVSEIPTEEQTGAFTPLNARYIHNLAGKYTEFYGTPFDLDEVAVPAKENQVDVNNIHFIRIVDVVGTLNPDYTNYDSKGNPINDPFPTPYASGGFDLDAIGVIHNTSNTVFEGELHIYPNPVQDILHIALKKEKIKEASVWSCEGKRMITSKRPYIRVKGIVNGCYILQVETETRTLRRLFLKK